MATPTYDLLDSTTLSSSASSVTFTSIDQSYRDLVLVIDGSCDQATSAFFYMYFNNDTGSNYSRVEMVGDGSSTSSASFGNLIPLTLRQVRGNHISQIMDYSATDKHKSVLYRNNLTDLNVYAGAGRWANTAAVTTLQIDSFVGTETMTAGTTLALYGIAS